jgi:hypothetical protein
MRKRHKDTHLPRCIYQRHGAYYLVKKGKWTRLATSLEKSLAIYGLIKNGDNLPMEQQEILRFTQKRVSQAKQNLITRVRRSKNREMLPFELTIDDIQPMLEAQDWKCAVTKTPFNLRKIGPYSDRPLAPSIDRIDSRAGYSRGNCQIVCIAANYAMNRWGAEPLLIMAENILLDINRSNRPEIEKHFANQSLTTYSNAAAVFEQSA